MWSTEEKLIPTQKELSQSKRTKSKISTLKHPLEVVFKECLEQVTSGKGQERHGDGKDFYDQPWRHIADTHGIGFLTGQAEKKLREAQGFEDNYHWKREMYGVIVYAAMAILHYENSEADKDG